MDSAKINRIVLILTLSVLVGLAIRIVIGEFCDSVRERRALRQQTTTDALVHLQGYLTEYLTTHGSLPGPAFRDAMDSLEKEGVRYYQSFGVKYVEPGVDGWGRPIIYELRDRTHAVLRSAGENGIDENGCGDDIERIVPIPLLAGDGTRE
jgi:hypothetical protein